MRNAFLIKALSTMIVLLATIAFPTAHAQTAVTPAEARAIAKEAYIYGNPLADSYRILYTSFVDRKNPEYKGPWNQIHNISRERGYTVAIVPTGGVEQNGPQMVLGKHDYIVRKTSDRVARQLGNALVTPVVSFVPEGNYDPPSGNLLFPRVREVSMESCTQCV